MSDEKEMTISGLNSVLTQFLDEIDDLGRDSDEAPCSEWIVHVDPVTSQSFYRHIRSGETKWDMPKEYETYLQQFDAYFQLHAQINNSQGQESPKISKRLRPSSAKRKKKKKKRLTDKTKPDELEIPDSNGSSSQILIAYSDSSGSDSESDHKSENERHSTNCVDHEDVDKSDSSDSVIVPLVSYGPSDDVFIPEPKDFIKIHLSSLVCSETGAGVSSRTTKNGSLEQTVTENHSDKELRSIKKAIKRLVKKFDSFNQSYSNISTIQLLYIQLFTRFDDWQVGKLPTDYFVQKLFETERTISELEDDRSPLSGQKSSHRR